MILCCCSEIAPAFPTGSRELACAMVSVPACSKQPWQCCCGSRILVLQALNRKARAVPCAGSLTLAGPAGNGVCPAGIPLWALKTLWEAKDPWTLTRVVLCSVSEPKMFCEHPWLVFGTLFLIFPPLLCALAVRTRWEQSLGPLSPGCGTGTAKMCLGNLSLGCGTVTGSMGHSLELCECHNPAKMCLGNLSPDMGLSLLLWDTPWSFVRVTAPQRCALAIYPLAVGLSLLPWDTLWGWVRVTAMQRFALSLCPLMWNCHCKAVLWDCHCCPGTLPGAVWGSQPHKDVPWQFVPWCGTLTGSLDLCEAPSPAGICSAAPGFGAPGYITVPFFPWHSFGCYGAVK